MIDNRTPTVKAMGEIHTTGNIIDPRWYKTIVRDFRGRKRPDHVAIQILADLLYWHRPTVERDEATGQVVAIKKRFKGDLLQKSYGQYANMLGEDKERIKQAFDLLEERAGVKRVFRTIRTEDGYILNNVMFIDFDVQALRASFTLTHAHEGENTPMGDDDPQWGAVKNQTVGGMMTPSVGVMMTQTNTSITTEITTEITTNHIGAAMPAPTAAAPETRPPVNATAEPPASVPAAKPEKRLADPIAFELEAKRRAEQSGALEVTWVHEEGLKPYVTAFIQATGYKPMKRDYGFWVNGARELREAGAQAEDIKAVVDAMRKDGLSIKSPSSLLTTWRNLDAQKRPSNILDINDSDPERRAAARAAVGLPAEDKPAAPPAQVSSAWQELRARMARQGVANRQPNQRPA